MSQKTEPESTTGVTKSSGNNLIKKCSVQKEGESESHQAHHQLAQTTATQSNLIKKRPKPESTSAEGGTESTNRQKQDVMSPRRVGVKIMSPLLKNQSGGGVASSGHNSANKIIRNSSETVRQHKATALELRSRGLLPRHCKNIPLKIKYLEMILDGSKVIEGRINSGMPAQCRPNDFILFFSGDVCCLTKVREKTQYPTFREMLAHHGIRSCLPDFKGNLDAAEKLYRSFPGYAEKEQKFGVLSLDVQLASSVEMKAMMQERQNNYNDNRGKADRGSYGYGHQTRQHDGRDCWQRDSYRHSGGAGQRHPDRRGDGDGDFRRDRRLQEGAGSGAVRRDRSRSRDRDGGRNNGW